MCEKNYENGQRLLDKARSGKKLNLISYDNSVQITFEYFTELSKIPSNWYRVNKTHSWFDDNNRALNYLAEFKELGDEKQTN
jgi:hypothetical protein